MRHDGQALRAQLSHAGFKRKAAALVLGLAAIALRLCNGALHLFASRRTIPAVLIIEPFGLGDVISLEPLTRLLADRGCDVRLCARAEWLELFRDRITRVPAVVPWGSFDVQHRYSLGSYWSAGARQFLRNLRGQAHGAVGIDTRGDLRSILLLYLAGCRRVITLANYLGSDLVLLPGVAERVPYRSDKRRWELNLDFAPRLGIEVPSKVAPPCFEHLLVPSASPQPRLIGIIPVAPWEGKLWLPQRWRELIRQLQQRGFAVQVLCGPGQSGDAVRQTQEGVTVIECRNIQEWVRLLPSCACAVTLDTGPMHLADALGVPVVALFGQGLLPLWAPSGARSRTLAHRDMPGFFVCHPTRQNTSQGRQLMDLITVEEVLAAVEAVLPSPPKPPTPAIT